jgi:hypothetical protein
MGVLSNVAGTLAGGVTRVSVVIRSSTALQVERVVDDKSHKRAIVAVVEVSISDVPNETC